MTEVVLCEPAELYNLLNQTRSVPRLAETNYLCLIDAQETRDFLTGHIITAKHVKTAGDGTFYLPDAMELDTMQNLVIYDANTSSLEEENGRAIDCARELGKSYYRPIHILAGGYRLFSAIYPFLRTEKTLYTIWELENLKLYPLEILPGQLYMGDLKQSQGSLWNLKIRAIVSISLSTQSDFSESEKEIRAILDIPLADKAESDLLSNFKTICNFISSHIDEGSRVLVVSKEGTSRCSAVVLAFLIHHFRYTLEEAWSYLVKRKPTMRPNTGFLQQLCEWEVLTIGKKDTNLLKPPFL
ncbi:serine/threonine/tyrosine-interacting-like protein 1 [Poeciliopsis prolifica]|uniref:serine/threonine/tyrosine-interacting-like protein 1 n=1 Tax=Poeciliopsis prolifica TaxID=188132 RepID=UPI0024139D45|nr:serine/threonine/tyrosine-interacting-like protein 1 [Poeciliopsis prolifica]